MSTILQQDAIPLAVDAHGTIRVGGTRVTLDSIVRAYQSGETVEQIAEDFSALQLADVHAAIFYYLRHRAEVEEYLAGQDSESASVRNSLGAHQDAVDVRARLQARRSQSGAGNDTAPGG